MDDLISRAAAKAAIRNKFQSIAERCEINEVLNGLPVVDAMPVVRCGDCKYWYAEIGASTGWLPCQEIATDRNWFCASGKRRESE